MTITNYTTGGGKAEMCLYRYRNGSPIHALTGASFDCRDTRQKECVAVAMERKEER